jgi:hypothetical protein
VAPDSVVLQASPFGAAGVRVRRWWRFLKLGRAPEHAALRRRKVPAPGPLRLRPGRAYLGTMLPSVAAVTPHAHSGGRWGAF